MSTNNDYVNNVLQHLFDSVNGLSEAAEQAERPSLKEILFRIKNSRQHYIDELTTLMKTNGIKPIEKPTITGKMHQFYVNLKGFITNGDADEIKEEIKRGDSTLLNSYSEAISNTTGSIKKTLDQQMKNIQNTFFQIDSF